MSRAALYPQAEIREADVVLRDGSTVHLRSLRPADEPALLAFLRSLSTDSRALRYFSAGVNLEAIAHLECTLKAQEGQSLVATMGIDATICGHAVYRVVDDGRAEVAFAVSDALQGHGLGTVLLGRLAEIASGRGIHTFEAHVLPANYRMLEVFRTSGFPVEMYTAPGELSVTLPTSLTEEAVEQFERREQIAAISALRRFLQPSSVAVIGASRKRGTPGGEVFHNLLTSDFQGPVYPVNPSASVVQCVPTYPTVEEVPGPVDLAVIIVPAAQVQSVAEQCARKGVGALVVISAGFAEVGDEGRARQSELLHLCRATGMRLIGPNCIGIANTDPSVQLNGTFGPVAPPLGRIGFSSQSGALGLAAMDYAGSLGLGISSFVSVGNKADISGNDLLNYWESDSNTDVILLYLESFGNPRKFSRIARRVGREKPIVVVKSGRSSAGARASSSHTGALLAASDVTVDALFRQSGVVRTDTMEELFGVASLLAHQPLPTGRRVAIVTNVGGPGILCADACEAHGLEVPALSEETRARLQAFLPSVASVANPIDMIASATAEQYRLAIEVVGSDPNVDAVITIFIPPLQDRTEEVAEAVVEGTSTLKRSKPVLTVFMSSRARPVQLRDPAGQIPSFAFPESAAIALAHVARYAEWRRSPVSPTTKYADLRTDEAAAVIAAALERGGGWLEPDEVREVLDCYGLVQVEQATAAAPDEAGCVAAQLGGEVALKAIAPGFLHKTDAGLVRLGLRGETQVAQVAQEMVDRLLASGAPAPQFVVQRMVTSGVEMILGVVHDRQFGPVVACGAGGTMVEVLKDVSVGLTPLTPADAVGMVHSLKTYPLLNGYRGAPPCDVARVEDALLRLSALAEDFPQIAELDCNPLMVQPHQAVIVDARIRVEVVPLPLPLGARS